MVKSQLQNEQLLPFRRLVPAQTLNFQMQLSLKRQRTAIIEQMLCSGHFMLLDKPFSGLDVGNIANCKETFRLYYEAHEMNTIIYSTHEMKLAIDMADSIYVIGHNEEHQDHSTIVKHYDLKAMGLAWREFGSEHLDFLNELTNTVKTS